MRARQEILPGMVDRIKKMIKAKLGKKGRAKLIFRNLCEEGRIAGPEGFVFAGEPER